MTPGATGLRPRRMLTRLLVSAVGLLSILLMGGCDLFRDDDNQPSGAVLSSLSLAPTDTAVTVGDQQAFTVTGNYSDGTRQDLTANAVFSSSDAGVASIDAAGVVSAHASGETTISASTQSLQASTRLRVLDFLRAVAGRDQSIVIGETVILNAAAHNADGTTTYAWQLIDKPAGSAVTIVNPTQPVLLLVPDLPGDFVFELTTSDSFRTSDPVRITLTALAADPPPPAIIEVTGVQYSAELDGIVHPGSTIDILFDGPVDAATLTPANVQLVRLTTAGREAIAASLSYEPNDRILTLTPNAPLPWDSAFEIGFSGIGATVQPFVFLPASIDFLTPRQEFSIVRGRVLDPDLDPLEEVTVRIAGLETRTDENGLFEFVEVPTGPQDLTIDPSTVNSATVYTPLHFLLDIVAGIAPNGVDHPIILTAIDTSTAIRYPAERVLTSPQLPGFELDLTGVTLTDPANGSAYSGDITVSIVIPTNVPMPFPGATETFWTIQPGGLLINPGAKITVPLPIPMDPGLDVDLWAFDHGTNQWVNYGTGTVNAGGTTATSKAGEGLPFTGWHGVVTRNEVTRPFSTGSAPAPVATSLVTAAAVNPPAAVMDGNGNPLHGVLFYQTGGGVTWSDYGGGTFSGTVAGRVDTDELVVGYNIFVNGTFDSFSQAGPLLCAFATELSDERHKTCQVVLQPGDTNPSLRDGGLPTIAPLKDFVFSGYPVVDSNVKIHLHKDLHPSAEKARWHHLQLRKTGDPIASSARYLSEVDAVRSFLRDMGLRENDNGAPLPFSSQYDRPAATAVKLFQAIWGGRNAPGGNSKNYANNKIVNGIVDKRTLADLNTANCNLWDNDVAGTGWSARPPPRDRNTYQHITLENFLGGATPSVIVETSRGVGGRLRPHQDHKAGSDVDARVFSDAGTPYRGDFYERTILLNRKPGFAGGLTCNDGGPLNGQFINFTQFPTMDTKTRKGVTRTISGAPLASEEWTPLLPCDQWADKTWRRTGNALGTAEDPLPPPANRYSRSNTQAFINALSARGADDIIFNDPGITGARRVSGHQHHVHFSRLFRRSECTTTPFAPASAAIVNPAAAAVLPPGAFGIVSLGEEEIDGAVDPAATITLLFSAPVDPATIDPASLQLVRRDTGEDIPYSALLNVTGDELEILPADILPEGEMLLLIMSSAITSLGGQPLEGLPADGVAGSWVTSLRQDMQGIEFDPAATAVTRADLQVPFQVIATDADGTTRDISAFIDDEAFALFSEQGDTLPAVEDGVVARVFNGRSSLVTELDSGLSATAYITADLIDEPVISKVTFLRGETVGFVFPSNPDATLVSAEIADEDGEVYAATGTSSNGGLRLDLDVGVAVPAFQDLRATLRYQLTDGTGNSLEVILLSGQFQVFDVAGADTDGDGLPDALENQLFPCVSFDNTDTDGDGIPDGDEDCDGDTLTNLQELALLTNPGAADSDADGVIDPVELRPAVNCNPIVPELTTVTGRIVDNASTPVNGATASLYGRSVLTQTDGTFAIPDVSACPVRVITVAASLDNGTNQFDGISGTATTVLNGTTDVGDIRLQLLDGNPFYAGYRTVDVFGRPVGLAVDDLDGNGTLDLLAVGNGLTVQLGNPDASYLPYVTYPVGGTAIGVSSADLDGDGIIDVVTTNSSTADISVLLGNGDGTLQAEQRIAIPGSTPHAVAIADFDEDGVPDLATANGGGNDIAILLGNGDGSFGPDQRLPAASDPRHIVAADINTDNHLDLLVAKYGPSPSVQNHDDTMAVFLGNGDGTFAAGVTYPTGERPTWVATGDLDRNGTIDVVTANYWGTSIGSRIRTVLDGDVSVLLGIGDGTFAPELRLPVNAIDTKPRPESVGIADMDNDGNLDIVSADANADTLAVIPGNGDGTFQPAIVHELDGFQFLRQPRSLRLADEDGDGNLDAFFVSEFGEDVGILRGRGDGSLAPDRLQRIEVRRPDDMVSGDLDRDGDIDLVVMARIGVDEFGLQIILGNGDGTFQQRMNLPLDNDPGACACAKALAVGDIDNNGTLDLAVASAPAGAGSGLEQTLLFMGNGDGTFNAPVAVTTGEFGFTNSFELADLNGDGNLDIVGANFDDAQNGATSMVFVPGNGDGTFGPAVKLPGLFSEPSEVRAVDLDLDGDLDVIAAQGILLYLNTGNGTLTAGPAVVIPNSNSSVNIGVADFNLDLLPDVVSVNAFEGHVFLGKPGGGMEVSQQLVGIGTSVEAVEAVDVNGDSVPDVVAMDTFRNLMQIHIGNGDGTFLPAIEIGAGPQARDPVSADFDGDGRPDLATYSESSEDVQILLHR